MLSTGKIQLRNILLADDGTEKMQSAIQMLTDMPHSQECVVTVLRVFTPTEGSEYSRVEKETEQTISYLQNQHFQLKSKMIMGNPSEMILNYAEENPPDLIVMGNKATGSFDGLLGNVATQIVHTGRWPVLIVRTPYTGLKRVLLVTDGSPASLHTNSYFREFPLPDETLVELMHVVAPVKVAYPVEPAGLSLPTISVEDEARLNQENVLQGQEFLEKAQNQLGRVENSKLVLRIGDPIDQILTYIQSEKIDLLVCGSRGSGNITGWIMGSISRELVIQAGCSVLIVRTPPVNHN